MCRTLIQPLPVIVSNGGIGGIALHGDIIVRQRPVGRAIG